MGNRFFLPALFLLLAAAVLPAVECFSENGIAANFVDIKGKWKEDKSIVRVRSLPEGLRFTFYTGVKNGDFLFNKAKHDSPAVVGKESIELQICPDPSTGVYYHIGVNPAGTLYTARKKDTSWEPGQLKADVKDWSRVTIEVSYADLGQKKPPLGSAWKVNFCHTRAKGHYTEHFSWSGTKDFHNYKEYGTLRFGTSNGPQVILSEQSAAAVKATVLNGKGCHLEMVEDGQKWRSSSSNTGLFEFTPPRLMEIPVKSFGKRTFRLKDSSGRILWERSALSGFDNRSYLELDRYYYTPADKKLQWKSTLKGKKEFSLAGPVPRKWSSDRSSGSEVLPDRPGRYLLTVKSGNCHISRVLEVTAAAPLMRHCAGKWERKGEYLYCGNRMRFLVGGSQTKVLKLHHGNCFNLAHISVGNLPGAIELPSLTGKKLRRAPEGTGYLFPGDEAQTLESYRAQAVKLNNQKLKISRVAYEAQMKSWLTVKGKLVEQNSAKLYKKIYDELKKYAPHQLFSLQIDRQEQAERFAPACDVFEVAVRGSYKADPMPAIAQEIRKIRNMVPGKVLFHWFGVTVPDNYSRSAEELRAELYLAFINNSAGVLFHLGHGFLPAERSRLWSVISTTGAELDEMMQEFHNGKPVAVNEPAGFQTAVRDCGSYWLIVGVNCSNTTRRMKLALPGKKIFSALFSGFEARVFRIRK